VKTLDAKNSWVQDRFKIHNLFDMLNFDAKLYLNISKNVALLEAIPKNHEPQLVLCREDIEKVNTICTEIGQLCDKLGLFTAPQIALKMIEAVKTKKEMRSVESEAAHLWNVIEIELKNNTFLLVGKKDADEWYSPKEPLFGKEVDDKFKDAAFDITETGKCLALDRYTAAVIHAMRVLEHGLRALGKTMKIRYTNPNWGSVLDLLQKKWKIIEARKNKPRNWRKDKQFFAETFVEFGYIKDAWRNHVMHASTKYTADEAKKIIQHVKSVMQHIAKRV